MPIVHGCPSDLDATGKERWRLTHDFIDKEGGGWHDVYASTLERYVRAWALCDALKDELATSTNTVLGSNGQPVANPLLAALDTAAKRMDVAAQRLRLTPEARAKAGESAKPPVGGKFGDRLG
jgi:P27 family predicted phage terminase small subunit